MHPISEITVNYIRQLDAVQLTDLLGRLLKIEAQQNDLKKVHIAVPGRITVPDGGEDGRIERPDDKTSTNWLPTNSHYFNVKRPL